VAASSLPYTPAGQVPAALDQGGMDAVIEDFSGAARMAGEAGVGLLEVHLAHGYLLASFLSPLTNQRDDAFGGPIDQRLAFPLEVVRAVRAVWPADRILSVCITAGDLQPGGISEDDVLTAVRLLADAGVDLFHVVSGQTTPLFRPRYDTAYDAGWSDLVRNRARVPTIVGGNIPTVWVANNLLAAGKADLCILGRPWLPEPAWMTTEHR
jgi:anthraniloyl-CoA monooxygenase